MHEMNSLERVRAVLAGRVPDRVPVGLHNYLMACRMADADLGVVLRDGEALAAAQLAAWREFGHDVIMHENGVHAEAEAMGCGVLYQSGIAPHVDHPIVTSLADIDRLRVPDPETTFPLNEVLKATRLIVAETAGRVFINGRADQGPVALALALCGPERFLTWVGEPESRSAVHRLLDICSRMNIAFGEAQIRAGAHSSTIGLAGHSLISPATFDELELPRARAFCEALRAAALAAGSTPAGMKPGCCPISWPRVRPALNWTRGPIRCRASVPRAAAPVCSACCTRCMSCATRAWTMCAAMPWR